MAWRTIVIGIDGSDASRRALGRAGELASTFEARLVVTSVAPVLAGMAAAHGLGPWDPADSPERHQAELERAAKRLQLRGVTVEIVLGTGEPAEGILDLAEREGADMIVVGTREPGLLERLTNGSVSRAVSHHAHCDVLIVH